MSIDQNGENKIDAFKISIEDWMILELKGKLTANHHTSRTSRLKIE